MAKEVKGSTPIPYTSRGMCEDFVQPWAMECTTTHHDLGGYLASTSKPILWPTYLQLIKKFGYTFFKLKNCCPKFLLANLTNQITHHLISRKGHQSNKSCQKQLDQND